MTQELKPCPFCGGKAHLLNQLPGYSGASVWCEDCEVSTASIKSRKSCDEADNAAVAAWNRRAAPEAPDAGVVAELVEALRFYADPETYHAVMVLGDSPCGEFASDISDVDHGFYENSYGAKARAALAKWDAK